MSSTHYCTYTFRIFTKNRDNPEIEEFTGVAVEFPNGKASVNRFYNATTPAPAIGQYANLAEAMQDMEKHGARLELLGCVEFDTQAPSNLATPPAVATVIDDSPVAAPEPVYPESEAVPAE